MIGKLHVEVRPSERVPDFAHIEIWEGWGTILKRRSVRGVMDKQAASELARMVNGEDECESPG